MEVSFDRELDTQAFAYFSSQGCTSSIGETPSRNSRTQSASQSVLNHDRAYVKPMMGNTQGRFKTEAGYNEKEGAYGKATVSWEWGGRENRSESSRERPETDRPSGEVNSTDRN